jgi:thioesterase domain-containing protein
MDSTKEEDFLSSEMIPADHQQAVEEVKVEINRAELTEKVNASLIEC